MSSIQPSAARDEKSTPNQCGTGDEKASSRAGGAGSATHQRGDAETAAENTAYGSSGSGANESAPQDFHRLTSPSSIKSGHPTKSGARNSLSAPAIKFSARTNFPAAKPRAAASTKARRFAKLQRKPIKAEKRRPPPRLHKTAPRRYFHRESRRTILRQRPQARLAKARRTLPSATRARTEVWPQRRAVRQSNPSSYLHTSAHTAGAPPQAERSETRAVPSFAGEYEKSRKSPLSSLYSPSSPPAAHFTVRPSVSE